MLRARGQTFAIFIFEQDGGSWIWGNEKQVHDKSAGVTYTEWMETLGRTFRIQGALGVCFQLAFYLRNPSFTFE
jgi:hypothetical protein